MPTLALDIQFGEDIVVVNKPTGIATHSPDINKIGMAEIVQAELLSCGISKKIHVVHRLDKTTTGVLIFATSEQKAKELVEDFQNHRVQKKYHFLTAEKPNFTEAEAHSFIEKKQNAFVSKPTNKNEANASTYFKKIKLNSKFQLWQATPVTGKTHQIRLHAKELGLSILGDTLYGGMPYPHLCLHAAELEIPGKGLWKFDHPPFFERMGLIRDPKLCEILSAFDSRQRTYKFLQNQNQSLRLMHLENNQFRIDVFGEIMWVYWYSEQDPTTPELERFEFASNFIGKKVLIRKMQNRGTDPLSQTDSTFCEIPDNWEAKEDEMTFEFRKKQGLSPGLFLDQRQNRKWVRQNSENKKILNLFSYTGGFSLAAALGKAAEVVSVDLSKNFLEWTKKNFELNQVSTHEKKYQFFSMNTFRFLEGTQKKGRKFDMIICDPPSFSRDNKSVFRIEKDFSQLLDLCWSCLENKGVLIFSTNYEKWDEFTFQKKIKDHLNSKNHKFQIVKNYLPPQLDYEKPNEDRLMKSIMLQKI